MLCYAIVLNYCCRVYEKQWWRLLSAIVLHGGVWHILPNAIIQLRVGGYLNLVFGTPMWFMIYFTAGTVFAVVTWIDRWPCYMLLLLFLLWLTLACCVLWVISLIVIDCCLLC